MESTDIEGLEREHYELVGAVDAISTLREELELRLGEARDDCVREVLDNVISLVDAHSIEYQHRKCELRKELGFENLDESER